MRIAAALIAVLALTACKKDKKDAPKDEPVVTKPTETGSGSSMAGSGSSMAGSGSDAQTPPPAAGSGSAAQEPPPASSAVSLPDGFAWTPSEDAFSTGNDAANPVAWGDDAEIGL